MSVPALETTGLTKHFGRVRAVQGLDLSVGEGQVFGFLGPNGAGKSTTMRMIMGLVRPTRGDARILGYPSAAPHSRAPGTIGALVEGPAFYGYLTARQNLTALARLSGAVRAVEVEQALALVGLQAAADRKVSGFSHGMRQRLGLAQALLPRPRVLLLDEPSLGLDPQGRVEMRELLQQLNREAGVTIFLSSHLLGEVEQLCTHLAIVAHGRLLRTGPTARLLAGECARVELAAEPVAGAEQVLASLPPVRGVERQGDQLCFSCAPEAVASVNAALVAAGIAVSALVPRREDLEELYLRLMREAEDVGGA